MPKKQTKRSKNRYPSLDPGLNLKTRSDQIDYDYINTLPDIWTDPKTGKKHDVKKWLNDFTSEYVNASFNNEKRIHKKKKVKNPQNKTLLSIKDEFLLMINNITELVNNSKINVKNKAILKKNLNKYKKTFKAAIKNSLSNIDDYYKKDSETRNNARNACIMTRAKAQGKVLGIDLLPETVLVDESYEDSLIERIDALNLLKKSQES